MLANPRVELPHHHGTVARPSFDPPAETFIDRGLVCIRCETPGVSLFYTVLDQQRGGAPCFGQVDIPYTGPVILEQAGVFSIRCFGEKEFCERSKTVESRNFIVKVIAGGTTSPNGADNSSAIGQKPSLDQGSSQFADTESPTKQQRKDDFVVHYRYQPDKPCWMVSFAYK